MDISEFVGKTFWKIEDKDDELRFHTTDAETYLMFHNQNCCESVYIEDICGDLKDLIGTPIVLAEERNDDMRPPVSNYHEAYLWTFYELATIRGSVTIRWYGHSNGYYSVSVKIKKI